MVLKTIKKMLEGKGKSSVDFSSARRNDPCPCGSGKKFKGCHAEGEGHRRREAGYSKMFRNSK